MKYRRMPIEVESPEQLGYEKIKCNLTESSMSDLLIDEIEMDLKGLVLCYTDHAGKPELREQIASQGEGLSSGDVIVAPGAAASLFITATSILGTGDHLIVARPNYATNIETPRAIGCDIDFLDLQFEDSFRLDIDRLRSLVKPETKLISLTTPHNPTGAVISRSELEATVELAEKNNCYLLVDETYRDMAFDDPTPLAASLSPNVISVSSLSKTYGLPGIRIGWLISRNKNLMETFLAAKEQIFICNSVVDEHLAWRLFIERGKIFSAVMKKIRGAFDTVKGWIEGENSLEWVEPKGGVVCFPRIKSGSGVDVDKFYSVLNNEYGTYVGPGHWFEMERRYMRIGYGWPKPEELIEGLVNISRALIKSKTTA